MDKYKLPYEFKRGLVFDALYSTRFGDVSISEWANNYLAGQEVMFPGEKEFLERASDFLRLAKFRFDPREKSKLVDSIVRCI